MPVYLCQPGFGSTDPWKHGIQVYATPFAIDQDENATSSDGGVDSSQQTANATSSNQDDVTFNSTSNPMNQPGNFGGDSSKLGAPIRRVRHSEVVLADDICVAHDRYWLRLRWPGKKGGFAGYIALGKVDDPILTKPDDEANTICFREGVSGGTPEGFVEIEPKEDQMASEDAQSDEPSRNDEPQDNASTFSSEPFESTSKLRCLRTGLNFPSTVAMTLMPAYDDGIRPPVISAPLPSENVFCRICREGLHDDADDELPASESETNENTPQHVSQHESMMCELVPIDERDAPESRTGTTTTGPIIPHPKYHPNPQATENPMLAPCECSGSMAFVRYLSIEQWRCRSQHPDANNGLNCETCKAPYALPPPTARVQQVVNEDWLEAMPPHVMAALRNPHVWWRVGGWIVRQRWLRPIAPVVMSPVVALYCRARRLLKKKGVARRRWACSLCRRRARWKCVRCLRSYYCSRQCQNVSWHIVHKHICYKPSRWAWSVALYGLITLFLFPGILRDPLMYDLGLGFVPVSFYAMAILGGGFAAATKKTFGVDLRGRTFEVVVILSTLGLVLVSWGLVGAFFGEPSRCVGVLGSSDVSEDNLPLSFHALRKYLLGPAMNWFLMWDRLADNSGWWVRRALCTEQESGCFDHLHKANADFIFEENGGGRCAADLSFVSNVFVCAGVVACGSHFLKKRDRQRRAARRPRPHQD
mmetsp:Transcript_40074/g.96756  ORF Transcript_40074/g.96756 Transcript_40074/m.96756 type:complete len:703 (+) Transcript_40074:159-2267(+)